MLLAAYGVDSYFKKMPHINDLPPSPTIRGGRSFHINMWLICYVVFEYIFILHYFNGGFCLFIYHCVRVCAVCMCL